MNDLTLIVCSYHTPQVLVSMLQSFAHFHGGQLPQKILIMENSRDEETVKQLDFFSIPYQRSPGDAHSPSLDRALYLCKTKYALVLDSDVLFEKSMTEVFDLMKKNGGHVLGELVKSRGGYKLMNRIGPWFMLVDVEEIQKRGIRFHDQKRIEETKSEGFFGNIPLQPNNGTIYYDVGSSFLEDVMKSGLKVLSMPEDTRKQFVQHYEGMSWRTKTGIPAYVLWGNKVESEFLKHAEKFKDIDLTGKFIAG